MDRNELYIHQRHCAERPRGELLALDGNSTLNSINSIETTSRETEQLFDEHLRLIQIDEPSTSASWPIEKIVESIIVEGEVIDIIDDLD